MTFSILTQFSPSAEQQQALKSTYSDVIVAAGAGAGKTRTLVARYLQLLEAGTPLRQIAAITFTQKAAHEMRNRLRQAIRRHRNEANLDPADQERWDEHYRDLDAARVGTIHSLCAEILRAHPAEADLDPRFDVLDEGQSNVLLTDAIDDSLAQAADQEALIPLFTEWDERGLRQLLKTLLKKRQDATALFAQLRPPAELLAHWRQHLLAVQTEAAKALLASPVWQDNVALLHETEPLDPTDKLALMRQLALDAAAAPPQSLSRLAEIKLRGGKKDNWPGGKETVTEIKAALSALRELWESESTLLGLELNEFDEQLADLLPRLAELYHLAEARYHKLKEELRALDFDDLETQTLHLLRQHPEVQRYWQEELQVLLVDEFQDTNEHQTALIDLLAGDDGTCFLVGDAKQSIYRFRNADVRVFRHKRAEIRRGGGRLVNLSTTYRAHAALVNDLNTLLAPILGEEDDRRQPWHEPFAALKPYRTDAATGFNGPHIEFQLSAGSRSQGALDRAADALVARLMALVEDGRHILPNGQPLDYGDIAILCRRTRSFAAYEDALTRADVPYLTVSGRGFYERPEIRDVLNALRAIADPSDDLALFGLLRSPACGLADDQLYQLTRAAQNNRQSLWAELATPPPTWPAADAARLEQARQFIADLHAQQGRIAVADLLKQFLDRSAYAAAALRANQARSLRNLNKLQHDAAISGLVSVSQFLQYVQGLRDSGTREGEARSTASGAVQLMTIHAAKGLEFPIVVLGDAAGTPKNRKDLLLDSTLGPLPPLNSGDPAAYELARHNEQAQAAAEEKRMLYVAATRAEELLLINGTITLKKDGSPGKGQGWLGELIEVHPLNLENLTKVYDPDGTRIHQTRAEVGEPRWQLQLSEPAVEHRLPVRTAAPAGPSLNPIMPPPLLASLAPPSETPPQDDKAPPQPAWWVVPPQHSRFAPANIVGELVHYALAAWIFPATPDDPWLLYQARNLSLVDPDQIADAARRSQHLLQRFQHTQEYQIINQANQRLPEYPFTRKSETGIDIGLIDLLFRQGKMWTVVEFKTDTVRNAEERSSYRRDRGYNEQIERYQLAVTELLGQRPPVWLVWLNHDDNVAVDRIGPAGPYADG